ncbi:hypothetical protein Taro_035111 [Colocasia esculenta]|uniref:Transposase n=1 Tax=Colocasia esculenta TaxID=4460 RepID=A0A843W9K2_COLES|nr:hypothetical protein [Colocasia esculenta]
MSPAELAEKAVAGRLCGGTCGEGAVSGLGQATVANLQAANLRRQQGNSGHPFLLPLFLCVSSTPPGVSCRPHHLLPPPLRSRNRWQVVVICKQEDNDMPFLMLLDSLHMGEHTRIENELKNFLKIAYEGKGMTALADEMKVIDLHVPKVPQQKGSTECGFMLTADWFSREEYEKFREDLQGKIIHIDAQSASTSKKRKFNVPINLRDFVMNDLDQKWRSWKYDLRTKFFTAYQKAQQHFACSDRRVVEDQWKKLVQIWSSEEFKFLKTRATLDRGDLFIRTRMKKAGGPVNGESAAMIDKIRDIKLTQQSTTSSSIASVGDAYEQSSASVYHAQKKKDSLARWRVRILNFSGEVVASGILISDDNDNVVIGKKLGGEYYEVSILIAHDPTASLFIKDADRKNMNNAVGSHIIWFREYRNILAYGVRGRRDTCLRFKMS